MGIYSVFALLITGGSLFAFQNCGKLQPAGPSSSNANSNSGMHNSGGEGYGGKTFLEQLPNGICPDKKKHSAAIEFPEDNKGYLVRDNCKELSLPIEVSVTPGSQDDNIVMFENRPFYKAGQFFSDPGFEKGPLTNPDDAANTYQFWDANGAFSGVEADAARSGLWGLRVKKDQYFYPTGHLHFLKSGTRYRLSFWARVSATSPSTTLRFVTYEQGRWSSDAGTGFYTDKTNGDTRLIFIDSTIWKKYDIEFYATGPAPYFRWEFSLYAGGPVVDLDDFTIEEVPCSGICTDFPLSGIPWKDLIGKTGTSLNFPQGHLDTSASTSILKVVDGNLPGGTGSAALSGLAAYQGATGFQFTGKTVKLLLATIEESFKKGHKYRIHLWARRVTSDPTLPDNKLPRLIYSSYTSTYSIALNSFAEMEYVTLIRDTNWHRYQIILEPIVGQEFSWQPRVEIDSNLDTIQLDEITIEEF